MKKLGYMNWILALILLEFISTILQAVLLPVIQSLATSYDGLIYLSMAFGVLLRLFLNFLWFTFTSRKYWSSVWWVILSLIRLVGPAIIDFRDFSEIIERFGSNINPTIVLFAGIVLNGLLFYLFYRRNEKELKDQEDAVDTRADQ